MYTLRGSFPEFAAFMQGYVSGAARAEHAEVLLAEWRDFERWLSDRIGSASPGEVLEALLAAHGEGASAILQEHLGEYAVRRSPQTTR